MEYEWEVECKLSRTTVDRGVTDDLESAKQAAEEAYRKNIDFFVGKYELSVNTDLSGWARYRKTEWKLVSGE